MTCAANVFHFNLGWSKRDRLKSFAPVNLFWPVSITYFLAVCRMMSWTVFFSALDEVALSREFKRYGKETTAGIKSTSLILICASSSLRVSDRLMVIEKFSSFMDITFCTDKRYRVLQGILLVNFFWKILYYTEPVMPVFFLDLKIISQ